MICFLWVECCKGRLHSWKPMSYHKNTETASMKKNANTLYVLGHNPLGSFPGVIWNWPRKEGKERMKKGAGHSRLVGGSFKQRGTYIWGSSWGTTRPVDFPQLSTRTLKICVEALTGLSLYTSRWPPHLTISRLCSWAASSLEKASRMYTLEDKGGGEEPPLPKSSSQANWQGHLPTKWFYKHLLH